jgi:hypothetical protein
MNYEKNFYRGSFKDERPRIAEVFIANQKVPFHFSALQVKLSDVVKNQLELTKSGQPIIYALTFSNNFI